MAITFKIQYAASATPIESTQLTDSNNVATSVHSSIDKSIGGGKEISCGSTATDVAYVDYTTITTVTTTLNAALGGARERGLEEAGAPPQGNRPEVNEGFRAGGV